jgi:hypothetical protein
VYIIAGNTSIEAVSAKMYIIAGNLKRKMYYIAGTVVPFRPVIDTPIAAHLWACLLAVNR